MASYEELREKHIAEAGSLLPEHAERLSWSADRLRQEREERLRTLVRLARERSPWHRKRLVDIDPNQTESAGGVFHSLSGGKLCGRQIK